MNEVRLGLIGCGGMGIFHAEIFRDVTHLKFTAASDSSADNLKKVVSKFGVRGFADGLELINSGLVDAVLIATPHYFHPTYAAAALKRGLHVLTEKPVAVTAKAAAEVERVHAKHPKLVYAAMHQMRTVPKWKKAKEIIEQGQLGPLRRVLWSVTTWFRTQAYYNSGSWRATWAGEGGGVLLNQCPHNLDLLCWLMGRPERVQAHLTLGKYHDIEVEDDVTAYLEFAGGATGVFITSTGEAPGTDYLEIIGDRGKLVVGKTMELTQTDQSVQEFVRTSTRMWDSPATTRIVLEPPEPPTGNGVHKNIHQNFIDAILDGEPLVAPAAEGLHPVELSNAIIMSGITGKPVDMPMDRNAYEAFLQNLIKKSKRKK